RVELQEAELHGEVAEHVHDRFAQPFALPAHDILSRRRREPGLPGRCRLASRRRTGRRAVRLVHDRWNRPTRRLHRRARARAKLIARIHITSTHPTSAAPEGAWRFRPTDHPDILPVRTFNDNYV